MNLEKKTKKDLLFIIEELMQQNSALDKEVEDLTKALAETELRYEQEVWETKEHMAAIKEEADYLRNKDREDYR